jgi:hypothetical protein
MSTTSEQNGNSGHLRCPFCDAYEVERLYLGSLHADSCTCLSCGARWDEDAATGGPDVVRGIYPLVATIDAGGYRELGDDDIAERVEQTIAGRRA